jgi:hypothetical protein
MHRLVHGLKDHGNGEVEEPTDPYGGRGAEMRDVVFLVRMQANRLYESDMHLIGDSDGAGESRSGAASLLGNRDERRDGVAGMRVIGGEERVVKVELSHRRGIGPGCPFRGNGDGGIEAEETGTSAAWVG